MALLVISIFSRHNIYIIFYLSFFGQQMLGFKLERVNGSDKISKVFICLNFLFLVMIFNIYDLLYIYIYLCV